MSSQFAHFIVLNIDHYLFDANPMFEKVYIVCFIAIPIFLTYQCPASVAASLNLLLASGLSEIASNEYYFNGGEARSS